MSVIDWALYSERAVGRGSVNYTDVINRPLREVLTASGQDPDASFPGFSLAGHTHDASAIVSGTLAPARGGTGLSSPAAGSLLVAAAAAAMTLLAPGASGQVVKSNGSTWAASALVAADVSDLTSAATGITRVGTVTAGAWQASPIADTYLATLSTAGKVANSATTATNSNTASAIVTRDASGNFVAGTITAALAGNASTASALATPRAINGVNFDGSAAITVKASTTNALTIGAHLTGSSFDGSAPITIATDATAANTVSTIVSRDGSGNFAAGVITAAFTGALTGNASTATKLAAAVNINGVAFDGSGNVTVPAAANTLTGTTLAVNVVASSLAGLGTVTAGTWNATIIAPAYGGTGVANANTITLGGNVNTAAALSTVGGALTLTLGGATNVTLPTSGTLVNTAVTTLSSLISVGTITTGVWNGTAITDANLATISTANKVATGAVAPGSFAIGAFAFQGAVSGITTLATSGAINGQTISSTASFSGSVAIANGLTVAAGTSALQALTATTFSATGASSLAALTASGLVTVAGGTIAAGGTLSFAWDATNGAQIQSFATKPLNLNPLGNGVTVGASLTVAGTTAVQALTATTGAFSSAITGTSTLTLGGTVAGQLVVRNDNNTQVFSLGSSGALHGTDFIFFDSTAGQIRYTISAGGALNQIGDFSINTTAFTVAASTGNVVAGGTGGFQNLITVNRGTAAGLNGYFGVFRVGTPLGYFGADATDNLCFLDHTATVANCTIRDTGVVAIRAQIIVGASTGTISDGSIWWDGSNFRGRMGGVSKTFTLT